MCDLNIGDKSFLKDSLEEDSGDNSDDNLKIVIDSPNPRKKTIPPKPSRSEKLIIESIEEELEKRLEEKAAKTKLNAVHVKNIIRHVVTNEHVLALVKKAENPNECDESIPYEPKLTRAKAKELLSSGPIPSVPWATPKQTSEVQALFSEDLQEDSSGDEYIPGEEESEDDRDGSIISGPPSVPPATPPAFIPPSTDYGTQTNWTEDGVFKIPQSKVTEDIEEETNIARRTRSKLCLSSTPLEVIEEAFIPPDITTDMYDMDCDNDDWMDFLKKFTRPLDEIAKATDDDEQDPEYNILADEEIDEVDKEELRVDKAVKVTRKELNDLIAELFDCAEIYNASVETEIDKNNKISNYEQTAEDLPEIIESSEIPNQSPAKTDSLTVVVNESNAIDGEKCTDIIINKIQIPLLEQQMRQHIQLLTQHFILTYRHPELHHVSLQSKEYLLNLKFLCENKESSTFCTINLLPALELVKYWEDLLDSNTEEVEQMKLHVAKTMAESFRRKQVGCDDIPTFPNLILETISKSAVFLYPTLLPKLPYKSPRIFPKTVISYTESEENLIALGLEQFVPLVKEGSRKNIRNGAVNMKLVCSYIQECIMPHKDMYKIRDHIEKHKNPRCANNPIKYYFQHKCAPPTVHYVYPINQLQILPPCKRSPDELPHVWKMFNYPHLNVKSTARSSFSVDVLKPQVYNTPLNNENSLLPKGTIPTAPICPSNRQVIKNRPQRKSRSIKNGAKNRVDPISKFVECLSRQSHVSKLFSIYPVTEDLTDWKSTEEKENRVKNFKTYKSEGDSMRNMPSIGTPVKDHLQNEVSSSTTSDIGKNQDKDITSTNDVFGAIKGESRRSTHEFSTISSTSFQQPDTSTEVEFCNPTDSFQTITTTCSVNTSASNNFKNLPSSTSRQEAQPNSSSNKTQSKLKQTTIGGNLEKDNPADINALMRASSTVKPTGRKEPSGAEKKRTKLKREFLANLSVSTPEDPEVEKQKNEMFALAYYDKMRENLDLEDYHKIMQILNDHEEGDAVDLYKKVEKVLSPKYQELADEFLLFLREKEAAAVGQLVPWIRMNNRSKFLRKLEIYFKDQPSQLRKIYKCLTELSQTVDVSMEKIKTTLLPMFKGNAVLSDLFLQNFLDERPPPSLLEGPYEAIDINKEMSRPDEEIFETITVPDVEDKFGGSSCICSCHQIEDPEFKTRFRHCIRCGTKFINGKVYIQTGRGLRPARVSFLTSPNTDHNVRLMGKAPTITNQRKKRSDNSPSKQVSPAKENPYEESEDEIDGKKKKKKTSKRKKPSNKALKDSKEPRKSRVTKKNVAGKCDRSKFSNVSPIRKDYKSSGRKRTYSARKSKGKVGKKTDKYEAEEKISIKPESPRDEEENMKEEPMEWEDHGVTGLLSADIKLSPDNQTAESESEFFGESSQDNCESDSNSSISSSNNHSQSDSNTGEECSWKREEDKIILETFQKENDKEYAFKIISNRLTNRTVDQISSRFQTLMGLLLETLETS